MTQTTTSAPRRNQLRSALALLAGLAVIFVLSLGTDQVLHALHVYPPWGQWTQHPGLNLLALAYRCVYAVLGCYLTARLAPRAPMGHALILGAIGMVLSTAGAVAMWNVGPHWYPVALALSSLPCAWLGGLIERRRRARRNLA